MSGPQSLLLGVAGSCSSLPGAGKWTLMGVSATLSNNAQQSAASGDFEQQPARFGQQRATSLFFGAWKNKRGGAAQSLGSQRLRVTPSKVSRCKRRDAPEGRQCYLDASRRFTPGSALKRVIWWIAIAFNLVRRSDCGKSSLMNSALRFSRLERQTSCAAVA